MNNIIEINHFNLSFGNYKIINNFNLSISYGETVGIFGHTGCGKTSLLNKIAEEYLNKYNISYVFQDNKLIESLSALKNVSLPLENFMNKDDAKEEAIGFLNVLKLEKKIYQSVFVLSGGEKQRVNIARAFAYPCKIMLMDEPFSAQDEYHRKYLIDVTNSIIKKRNITSVIVSHNLSDLESCCDKIINLGEWGNSVLS